MPEVYTRNDDGSISWEDAGGSAQVDLMPTLVVVASPGATLTPGGSSERLILEADDESFPTRTDQFTITDGVLTCVTAGVYDIAVYLDALVAAPGTVDVPGPVDLNPYVSVNEENKGPAWNYYPTSTAYIEVAGQSFPTLGYSFPQPLDVGDTVEFRASCSPRGTADLGTCVVQAGSAHGSLALTRIGDVP